MQQSVLWNSDYFANFDYGKIIHIIHLENMDLVIQVRDSEAPFLMELLKKFDFVRIKQEPHSPILEGLERSIEQMQAMREGKISKPPIAELFENERFEWKTIFYNLHSWI